MIRNLPTLLILTLSLMIGGVGSSSENPKALEHERLRLKNNFKTPEEVVSYYCGRDASGFVWSGLLDSERAAFTLWKETPQQDSFFIAKKYEVQSAQKDPQNKEQTIVAVKYEILGIGDAHGSRMPPPQSELLIKFHLKKVNGSWKIVKPDAREISPIVLESKFPIPVAVAQN